MNRSVALGAAWSASAVGAVGLGFLAVSFVNASASPGTSTVAATTTASTTPGAPASTSSIPLATGEYVTVAGTVYADCTGAGAPALAGAPAAGWWVDDSNDPGELEFETGNQKLEVHVLCVNGSPQFSDEGLRSDDSGRGRGRGGDDDRTDSSSSPASSSSAEYTSGNDDSGGDDSSGRGRGRGSDDSGSDDSSGRGGGGHGSDD